jgi:hypothetical protein
MVAEIANGRLHCTYGRRYAEGKHTAKTQEYV